MYFQRYKDLFDVLKKTRKDSELKDIGKAKNVGFRVYDQSMVTYEQNKLDYLLIRISVMSWPMAFIQGRWGFDHLNKT